jgi:hypothetical protein
MRAFKMLEETEKGQQQQQQQQQQQIVQRRRQRRLRPERRIRSHPSHSTTAPATSEMYESVITIHKDDVNGDDDDDANEDYCYCYDDENNDSDNDDDVVIAHFVVNAVLAVIPHDINLYDATKKTLYGKTLTCAKYWIVTWPVCRNELHG